MDVLTTAAIVTAPALIGGFCYYQNNVFSTTNIQCDLKIKGNLRIIQLSDLHSKSFGKDNINLYNKVKEYKPDLILATGDIIDSSLKRMCQTINFMGTLKNIAPIIYIPGNNEQRCDNRDDILNRLKRKGVVVLNNEFYTLNIKGNKINILGLVEYLFHGSKSILKKGSCTYMYESADNLLKELEKKSGIKLLLSHYPENFILNKEANYSKYDFHIMFSGHAHGGQFIMPILGGLFAPGQGVLPKYYKGIYGEKNKLVVSRGLGNSGFPLRLFNRPDIVIVDIR